MDERLTQLQRVARGLEILGRHVDSWARFA
jgi:hypothetical protein